MRMPESENPFILSRSPIPPSPCSVWGLLIHPTLKVKVRVIVLVTRVVPSNPLQYNVYDTCTHNNRAITDSNYYHFSSLHKKASYCSTSLSIFFIYTHEWYINILLRQMCTHVAPDYWQIIALQGIKLGSCDQDLGTLADEEGVLVCHSPNKAIVDSSSSPQFKETCIIILTIQVVVLSLKCWKFTGLLCTPCSMISLSKMVKWRCRVWPFHTWDVYPAGRSNTFESKLHDAKVKLHLQMSSLMETNHV